MAQIEDLMRVLTGPGKSLDDGNQPGHARRALIATRRPPPRRQSVTAKLINNLTVTISRPSWTVRQSATSACSRRSSRPIVQMFTRRTRESSRSTSAESQESQYLKASRFSSSEKLGERMKNIERHHRH